MDSVEHQQTSLEFLTASDAEFAGGEQLQACEKLWGAATHAVMAVALERDWAIESHRDLKNAVQRLSAEAGDGVFWGGFIAAEKYHKQFYHKVYSAEEIEVDRPFVHEFVHRTLALLQHGAG